MLTLHSLSLPDASQGCFPPLLSENMAGSHKWCLEMNNKACKDSTEGKRGHVLLQNSDFLTDFDSGICITPAGSSLSRHKLLRGFLTYIMIIINIFFCFPFLLRQSTICFINLFPTFFLSLLVVFFATGVIMLKFAQINKCLTSQEVTNISVNSNRFTRAVMLLVLTPFGNKETKKIGEDCGCNSEFYNFI